MKTKDNAQFHIVLVKGWVQKGNKFLLAKRSAKELQAPGAWSLPGGKMEQEIGEDTIYDTLRKEIREEVGLKVLGSFELTRNCSFNRVDGAHVASLTFLCQWESGEAEALQETEDVAWFTLEELQHFQDAQQFLKNEIIKLTELLEHKKF